MSLKATFESVHAQVQDALEACQHLKDEDLARVLDDILLRQKFWAEDVGFELDPYQSMSKSPSQAFNSMRQLSDMKMLLEKLKTLISQSQER